jgi:hypothetical protein
VIVDEQVAERAKMLLVEAMTDAFTELFPDAPVRDLVDPKIAASWSQAKARRRLSPASCTNVCLARYAKFGTPSFPAIQRPSVPLNDAARFRRSPTLIEDLLPK